MNHAYRSRIRLCASLVHLHTVSMKAVPQTPADSEDGAGGSGDGAVGGDAHLHGSVVAFTLFFAIVIAAVLWQRPHLVISARRAHGRAHRFVACALLVWLSVGVALLASPAPRFYFVFDVVMAVLGIATTLTAAHDFAAHQHVKNEASGVLEQHTTVTRDEMLEHSFYQALNGVHILFLHFLPALPPSSVSGLGDGGGDFDGTDVDMQCSPMALLLALAAVTAPWLMRHHFPVNHFSANYARSKHARDKAPCTAEAILYRLKKYQYLLYKHCLLHGLNISLVLTALASLSSSPSSSSSSSPSSSPSPSSMADIVSIRVYWLALNVSYVLEFFLQTLVKKHVLSQSTMLALNQLLMYVATAAALRVVAAFVDVRIAALSLVANLVHRSADASNVTAVAVAALLYRVADGSVAVDVFL